MRIYFALILLLLFIQGCGPHGSSGTSTSIPKIGGGEPNPSHEQEQQDQHQQREDGCRDHFPPGNHQPGPDLSSFVLKASLSITMSVEVDKNGNIVDTILAPNELKQIITVINPVQTHILFDTSEFDTHSHSSHNIFSLGSILILDLLDNNLDVCPVDEHCGHGILRAYLAPHGRRDSCDDPRLLVRLPDTSEVEPVRVGASHATILKRANFSSTDHVAWLSSFYGSLVPDYRFSLDLRHATEGFHEFNLVIEYGLLP